MTAAAQALKTQLDQLSDSDKAEIASYLIEVLEERGYELDPEWDEEIDRRISEVENGTVSGELAEDVIARLKADYA